MPDCQPRRGGNGEGSQRVGRTEQEIEAVREKAEREGNPLKAPLRNYPIRVTLLGELMPWMRVMGEFFNHEWHESSRMGNDCASGFQGLMYSC